MRLSIKHATLSYVLITKNPNKNQKPPLPQKKRVKNSQNDGKNPYRRFEPLKHRQEKNPRWRTEQHKLQVVSSLNHHNGRNCID